MAFRRPHSPRPTRISGRASSFTVVRDAAAPTFKVKVLNLAIGCALAGLVSVAVLAPSPALAAEPPNSAASQEYAIPGGRLSDVLAQFAATSGVPLSFDPQMLAGLRSNGLQGRYSVREGFDQLLAGSGYQLVSAGNGGYSLRWAMTEGGSTTLAPMTVTGSAIASPSELPPAYAGGQVARGGRLGILGNKDFMETPFSQTSYTAKMIEDTQAKRLNEVLVASPSVTSSSSRFGSGDGHFIRGFSMGSSDVAYDGMYGLATQRRNSIEAIERVELLKGPTAFLNGVPPAGGIGGSVNLVPKRAEDTPLTRLTLNYLGESNVGAHLDVGRRFGPDNSLGVRVNAVQRAGSTTFDYNKEATTLGALALDYRGERLRLIGNFSYDKHKLTAPIFPGFRLAAGVSVPKAPSNSTNPNPPWTFTNTDRSFNLVRGEYDLSDNWTASLGYGWQNLDEVQYATANNTILNSNGDVRESSIHRYRIYDNKHHTLDAKLAGRFNTGPVSHQVAVAFSSLEQKSSFRTQDTAGSGSISNIYDLQVNYPEPSFAGVPAPLRSSKLTFEGVAIADTLGFVEDRLQLTLGLRHQGIRNEDLLTNVAYDKSAITPVVAVLGKVTDKLSLYANYIEGLQQAPSPPATAANFDAIFPPAKSKQKEVGAKYDFGRFAVTTALFEITQPSGITDPVTNIFSVGGEQTNRGVEVEGFGEIARGLRLIGGVSYTDAKLTKTNGGINQGKTPPNVPDWNVTLGTEWDAPGMAGLTLNGRMVSTSSRYLDAANTQRVPGWARFDIGARYATRVGGKPLTLRANIVNLFDRDYWESSSFNLLLGTPRTLSVSASVDF